MKVIFDDRKNVILNLNYKWGKKYVGDIIRSNCIVCRCVDFLNRMSTEIKVVDWRIIEDSMLVKKMLLVNNIFIFKK